MRAYGITAAAAVTLAAGLAVTDAAQAQGEVNIYSARHYQTDEKLYAEFEERTGIEVNRIQGKSDALIQRIESEGRNTPADVLITVDAGRLADLPVLGLVEEPVAAATYFGLGFCYDPIEVYLVLFNGALGNPFALGSSALFAEGWGFYNFGLALTLKETTLLVFTGLSVAVAFRAGLFNIGTQGQLVLGALGTGLAVLWTAPYVPANVVGTVLLVSFGLLVGGVVGGLYGAIPGALKAYADANEVITTIMLNFIAAQVAFVVVSEYFRNPDSQVVETTPLADFATILPVSSFLPFGFPAPVPALAPVPKNFLCHPVHLRRLSTRC